ncbi:hypothetical protein L873DRAFT_1820199 [Choiromyces venosus 120613-1]|uniref:Uncharacterized protein n=1 Tax=Choiromyces venosus 120613-1 TaxID=1336337 RepID=A0A3N4IYB8_9PEZI|nr:hypothetical protein L873DRAFT_1820199 [Choiromyces venosus 120613-1]
MSKSVSLCLGSQLLEFNRLAHSSFPSLFDQSIQQYAILFSFVSSLVICRFGDARIINLIEEQCTTLVGASSHDERKIASCHR